MYFYSKIACETYIQYVFYFINAVNLSMKLLPVFTRTRIIFFYLKYKGACLK